MQKQQSSSPHTAAYSPEQALIALRALHKRYVRSCGARFRDTPFHARAVPGWLYDPKTDALIKLIPQELSGRALPQNNPSPQNEDCPLRIHCLKIRDELGSAFWLVAASPPTRNSPRFDVTRA